MRKLKTVANDFIGKATEAMKSAKTFVVASVAAAAATVSVHAEALIANDTLEGLPQLGTDIGDFMGNLAPGLFKFLVLLAIASGIVAILLGIFMLIKKQATRVRTK